ncbi:glutathione S-transferase Mu 4 [Procambarus clarkii]|uniref:glutathione S-transferase Mu 4 n=1 Tax=Procambarus clarkii TaxID=6728 RepID=UPI001E6758E1|nr:glutathione S-transferase Mu 4-like [Procambarus clarkii]
MAPVLGYWALRGLAQPIRLALEYTGEAYEEKLYNFGSPDHDRSEWLDEKFKLGLDLPNLPYYIDGDVKITQSNAILRYIGRKHDLCGKTEQERIRVDVLENQAMDYRMAYYQLAYGNYNTHKEQYLKDLATKLKTLSDLLGDQKWFVGDQITISDFVLYELLDVHLQLHDVCLADAKNLQQFMKRFEALPAIKTYMASPRFMKAPLNGPQALVGNK